MKLLKKIMQDITGEELLIYIHLAHYSLSICTIILLESTNLIWLRFRRNMYGCDILLAYIQIFLN